MQSASVRFFLLRAQRWIRVLERGRRSLCKLFAFRNVNIYGLIIRHMNLGFVTQSHFLPEANSEREVLRVSYRQTHTIFFSSSSCLHTIILNLKTIHSQRQVSAVKKADARGDPHTRVKSCAFLHANFYFNSNSSRRQQKKENSKQPDAEEILSKQKQRGKKRSRNRRLQIDFGK